jgi:type I restriction enzyme S subunit
MVDTLWNLPDDWEWVALDKVCQLYGGGTPKRSHPEYFDGDIVWVTPTDLDINNPIQEIDDSQTKITQLGLNSSSAKLIPVGTVLFSSRATIGKIAIAGVPLSTNQGFANLVCNEGFDNHYLAWSLKRFTENIKQLASSTTYLEISRGNLSKFKIPIPHPNNTKLSLDIQQRIVARIESLLGEIKDNRLLLERMRRDTEQLLPNSLDEVFKKLEYNYEPELLQNYIIHLTSDSRSWSKYANVNYEGALFIKVGNVQFAKLDLTEVEKLNLPENITEERAKVQVNDVLVTITGTIGRCCVISENIGNAYVNQHTALIRLKEKLDPYYLMWFILTPSGGDKQTKMMQYGQVKPGLNLTNVRNLLLPVPDISIQKQIVSHITAIQQEVNQILEKIKEDTQNFNYLEQTILEKAFRGEL